MGTGTRLSKSLFSKSPGDTFVPLVLNLVVSRTVFWNFTVGPVKQALASSCFHMGPFSLPMKTHHSEDLGRESVVRSSPGSPRWADMGSPAFQDNWEEVRLGVRGAPIVVGMQGTTFPRLG